MCKTALAALAVLLPEQSRLEGIHILQHNGGVGVAGGGRHSRPAETRRGHGIGLRWPAECDGDEPGRKGGEVKLEKLSFGWEPTSTALTPPDLCTLGGPRGGEPHSQRKRRTDEQQAKTKSKASTSWQSTA